MVLTSCGRDPIHGLPWTFLRSIFLVLASRTTDPYAFLSLDILLCSATFFGFPVFISIVPSGFLAVLGLHYYFTCHLFPFVVLLAFCIIPLLFSLCWYSGMRIRIRTF